METKKVQWQAAEGRWLIGDIHADFDRDARPLESWASEQPDLSQVRLVLSATNYSTHWVAMPGVSNRNLAKALPFALEECLINDVDNYLVVPAGKQEKQVRAYVVAIDLIERLIQECELHHLQVRDIIPETQLLPQQNLLRQHYSGWQLLLPGTFEGWVPAFALTPVLENLLSEFSADQLNIWAAGLDQAQMVKTTIETGFAETFGNIDVQASTRNAELDSALDSKLVSLMVGDYQVRERKEDKPAAWWRPLAAIAAGWAVLTAGYLFIDNIAMKQQETQVRQAAVDLYKQLFPGERVRSLDRQMREKLSGGNSAEGAGFIQLVNKASKVYAASNSKKTLHFQSIRFNDRLNELVVEVKAGSLSELQTLKQALEQEGLTAEVASATNDKDGVKGRLKIGGAV